MDDGHHPHTLYIGLGSNLGPRLERIVEALRLMAREGVEPVLCSQLYETEPVGMDSSRPFYNGVCQAVTRLSPSLVMETLLRVEASLGRDRSRGMDREIDLDLLHYVGVAVDRPGLRLPHPRLQERRFVLEPWAEIAPDLPIPTLDATISGLLRRLPREGPWVRPTGIRPLELAREVRP